MNYIREITAFNQWAADQALSPSERIPLDGILPEFANVLSINYEIYEGAKA